MRIAYLSESSLPSRHANAVHVMRMCAAFAREGHDVTLFARRTDQPADDVFERYGVDERFGLELIDGAAGRGDLLRYSHRVRRRLRQLPAPDLIYGRHVYSLLATATLRTPMIYEVHAIAPAPQWRKGRQLTLRAAERLLLRSPRLQRVVVITQALRDDFLSVHSRSARASWDLLVAPDGADEGSEPGGDVPATGDPLRAGYVGHLYEGRGIDVVETLARRHPEVEFHIAGGAEREIAALRSRSAGVPNLVVHGYVEPAVVPGMLRSFDILLAPYQRTVAVSGGGDTGRWMSPLKLFEYMAAGGAIICSDLPVLREVVHDGVNGLLAAPDDVDAWSRALELVAGDDGLRAELGARARQMLLERYTWRVRARRVLASCAA